MRTGASVAFLSPPLFPWATLSYQFAFPFAHLIAFSGKRSELNKNKPRGRTRCWVPSIPRVSLLLGRGWQSRVAPRCAGRDAFRQGWRHRGSVTSRSPPRLLFPPFPPPRAPSPSSRPLPLRAPPAAPRAQLQERPQLCAAPLGTASPFSSPSSSFPPSQRPAGRRQGEPGSSVPTCSQPAAGGVHRPSALTSGNFLGGWGVSREPRQRAASILCRYGAALRGSGNCGGFARPGGYRGAPPVVRWAGEKGRERLLSAARGFKLRRRAGPRRVEALRGGVRSWGGAGPGRAGGTRCSRAHLGERQRPGSARGPARS